MKKCRREIKESKRHLSSILKDLEQRSKIHQGKSSSKNGAVGLTSKVEKIIDGVQKLEAQLKDAKDIGIQEEHMEEHRLLERARKELKAIEKEFRVKRVLFDQ